MMKLPVCLVFRLRILAIPFLGENALQNGTVLHAPGMQERRRFIACLWILRGILGLFWMGGRVVYFVLRPMLALLSVCLDSAIEAV